MKTSGWFTAESARRSAARSKKKRFKDDERGAQKKEEALNKLKHEMFLKAKQMFPACLRDLKRQIAAMDKPAEICVASAQRNKHEPWVYFLGLELALLFGERGFKTRIEAEEEVPFGSDPAFPYSVFHTKLIVDW